MQAKADVLRAGKKKQGFQPFLPAPEWRFFAQNAILNAIATLHSADRTHAGQTAQLVQLGAKQKLEVGGLVATFPAGKKWTAHVTQMLDLFWLLSVREASHRDQSGTITFSTREVADLLGYTSQDKVKKAGKAVRGAIDLLTQTSIDWHGTYAITIPQLMKSESGTWYGEVRLCWPERIWEMLAPKAHAAGKEKGKERHFEFFLTPYPLAMLKLDTRRQGIEAHAYYIARKALVQKRANAGHDRGNVLKGQTLLDADPLIDLAGKSNNNAARIISWVSGALATLTGDPTQSEADRKALFKAVDVRDQHGHPLDLTTLKGRGALDRLAKATFTFDWATYPIEGLDRLAKRKETRRKAYEKAVAQAIAASKKK